MEVTNKIQSDQEMSDDDTPKKTSGNIRPALKVKTRLQKSKTNLTMNSNSSETKVAP